MRKKIRQNEIEKSKRGRERERERELYEGPNLGEVGESWR